MSSIVFQTIKNRRSIRRLLTKKIPNDILEKILNVAIWAPSAHNSQPWRFIVIRDEDTKKNLANSMAEIWKKDLKRNNLPTKDSEKVIEDSVRTLTDPPVLILVCLTMVDMDKYSDKRRKEAEFTMGIQSVANSIHNILLMAHVENLGACWFCAPLFCPKTVRNLLGIPKNVYPQALITLGYPAEKPIAPKRKSLETIIYQNKWENEQ